MMIHFQSSAWCLCCPAHHVDWTAPTTPQGSNIFSHSSDRGWLRARYNSSVYFQARYSSWVYTTFGETNFIQYLVPTTPNFGGNGPESLSWADAMLSLALFFEQVLAMHIHNSWFQQLRILWVWTIELAWADAMLYLSCVRTSLGYESACSLLQAKYKSSNHEAARYMCRRLFTCAKCSTTGEVDAVCQSTQSGNIKSGYNSWPDYQILGG